ncbi:hypothetical protein PtA15_6A852 [Puccinia triticina]|uniref:Uncharacterized protein n=1 Tax=Puccinia triticina TaxID=208348 RepID=A0ABY7CNC9_9BASI|nr:uncharacterized protein PtA15_6A852 [Puccinia triticina]WAQ86220.1 hypothetical protein PtA15_6A852 [Puccinia triticina]
MLLGNFPQGALFLRLVHSSPAKPPRKLILSFLASVSPNLASFSISNKNLSFFASAPTDMAPFSSPSRDPKSTRLVHPPTVTSRLPSTYRVVAISF